MTILKHTISLCPECLIDVPAIIREIDGMAVMEKSCPVHGAFTAVVERDVLYYHLVQSSLAPIFYTGLIIDITYKCNIRCKWCYQHLDAYDVPTERIYALAKQMPVGYNIILSGGEPTLRPDFAEIVNTLHSWGYEVNAITNGYKLDWSLPCGWTLSHHPESQEMFDRRINEAREGGHRFASVIYTDNSLDDFYAHVKHAMSIKDLVAVFRMHSAAPVGGNRDDITESIFVSDMFKRLTAEGHELALCNPKTIFTPLTVDCVPFMLIAWSDKHNVDIVENHCEPWYHGKGNVADNLVNRIIRDN